MTAGIEPQLEERLRRFNQQHVLRGWENLDAAQRRQLVRQLQAVDLEMIAGLFDRHRGRPSGGEDAPTSGPAERARPPAALVRLPKSAADDAEWKRAHRRGEELLAAGKVGAILVAGGQGTRLGFPHPKGMYPIGPVSGCSLFRVLAEQLLARSRRAGVSIPYYVMTSDATHDETVAYFAENDHFDLGADNVYFFRQGNMPAVDDRTGKLLMAEPGSLCLGPDGHGGLLAALETAGLFTDMRERGIEFLYYHQVDNPTAQVCDPAFLGFHEQSRSEISTKVVSKRSAEERMGVIVEVDGQTQIIEYSDLPPALAAQTDAAGNLLLWAGNTAIHAFNRTFLERLGADGASLPFHVAHKLVPCLSETGELLQPETPNAFKFERFVFDALPQAERTLVVEADRAREFNPVKNATGSDTAETAQQAMSALFRSWLNSAGAHVDDSVRVEISPLFALDEDDVQRRVSRGTKYTDPVHLR